LKRILEIEFFLSYYKPVETKLVTIITIHIKTFHNYFISVIKTRFREVPGKQSVFSVVIQWLSYIGFIVYFLLFLIGLINIFLDKGGSSAQTNVTVVRLVVVIIVVGLIVLGLFAWYKTINLFIHLRYSFLIKLEGKTIKFKDKSEKKNKRILEI